MSYWLISIPNEKDSSQTLENLANASSRKSLSTNYEIPLPALKVGTLDSLMALSEDLSKADPQCEQIAKKIERAYKDIHKLDKPANENANNERRNLQEIPELTILSNGQHLNPSSFVQRFRWDEMRYNRRTPLKQLSESILKEAMKADDMLRKTTNDYAEVRQQYNAIERLETGSLLVRPISQYIKPKDLITGREYLDTLLVVVPRARKDEFESTYGRLEDMAAEVEAQRRREHEENAKNENNNTDKPEPESKSQNNQNEQTSNDAAEKKEKEKRLPCKSVVPGSHKILCDIAGEEFLLYRLVILKPGAEYYKSLLREKRYTVRPYKHDPEEDIRRDQNKVELKKQKAKLYNFLIQWCTTEYSESFSRWVHLKFIRLFVEGVLRYGLPVNFRAVIIDPVKGREKQLRNNLRATYGKLAGDNANLTAQLDPSEADPSGLGEDFYPYVYLPLNVLE